MIFLVSAALTSLPDRLLNEIDYMEFHRRDLSVGAALKCPVVVQLRGNNPQPIIAAARKLQDICDGVGMD